MKFVVVRYLIIACSVLLGSIALPAVGKPVKDTPVPADHQCNFVNYHHNEAKNSAGSGKCESDCDCDGMRSCDSGSCTGEARPAKMNAQSCNDRNYRYQEAWTKAGPGKCSGDCECDGLRTCTAGKCNGVARPKVPSDVDQK